jgi:hypothetical protein
LSEEGLVDVQREQAMEQHMADEALKEFEVQMGLRTPEVTPAVATEKELGPARQAVTQR